MKKTGLFGDDFKVQAKDILSERFIIPPFSILNAREGEWQDRKRSWLALGIRSELGRGENLGAQSEAQRRQIENGSAYVDANGRRMKGDAKTFNTGSPGALGRAYKANATPGGSPMPAMKKGPKGELVRGDGRGRPLVKRGQVPPDGTGLTYNINDLDKYRNAEAGKLQRQANSRSVYMHPSDGEGDVQAVQGGTSIFDPVLCELAYRWFCPPGGRVLDPFAGGSVRGIVAGTLGLQYIGCDLSERQLVANREQAETIAPVVRPVWVHGDSVDVPVLVKPVNNFDLMFSCPPYGDLEVYSEDPRDLSTLDADGFDEKYAQIIANASTVMADNSFAVFVVGDYRDKDGFYQNFPAKTCAAFESAGWRLYNEMILITAVGSLSLRVTGQFTSSRKVGKSHQNVLCFCRGNPKEFTRKWPAYD